MPFISLARTATEETCSLKIFSHLTLSSSLSCASKPAATGAARGSIAAGAVGTMVGGPAVGAVAAAMGGYTGSLAGTAGGLPGEGESTNKAHPRQAGLMLAVRMANANDKQQIIDCLKQHGAEDIEMAKGKWENGGWTDFNPVAFPHLVD